MIFTTPDKFSQVTFSPMDPITIYLKRLKGRPVRVFTGFLDQAPYLQLYPGTIELRASCTLKRLLHTYFDPALPYTQSFFIAYGWAPSNSGTWFSSDALNDWKEHASDDLKSSGLRDDNVDSSISNLLFATMRYIARWDPDQILIEKLPRDIFSRLAYMSQQFEKDNEEAYEAMKELMKRIIGEGSYEGPNSSGGVDVSQYTGDVPEILYQVGHAMHMGRQAIIAAFMTGINESGMKNLDHGDSSSVGWRQELDTYGSVAERMNVPRSAARFYNEIKAYMEGKNPAAAARRGPYRAGMSAGWIADAVQRPRSRSVYGDNPALRAKAESLLRQVEQKVGANSGGPEGTGQTTDTGVDKTIRADDNSGKGGVAADKIYRPINGKITYGRGWHEVTKGVIGLTSTSGSVHWHSGVDIGCPTGTPCIAPCDGEITMAQSAWSDGGMVHFKFTTDVGKIKAGTIIGWGHVTGIRVKAGQKVSGGQHLADSGNPGGGPHVHFIQRSGDDGGGDGSVDPTPLAKALQAGLTSPTTGAAGGSTAAADAGGAVGSGSEAAAGAFFATLNLPSALEAAEAMQLGGEKSLMNDKPLMPFIQQLCEASLRQFMSTPDGKFFAFYPDYFGEMNHRPPYWEIDDIEVLDGGIDLTDDAIVTHMYVVGDTMNPLGAAIDIPDVMRSVFTSGVVTIFNAFMSDDMIDRKDTEASAKAKQTAARKAKEAANGTQPLPDKDDPRGMDIILDRADAVAFLQRYGARPHVEDMPMIKHAWFEMFLAYQRFMLAWSKQFESAFAFTFMPELFPGGKVGFPDHGLQMYIEEVTHNFDYTSGFTTQAVLSAPSIYGDNRRGLPPNMSKAIIEPVMTDKSRATPKSANSARQKLGK